MKLALNLTTSFTPTRYQSIKFEFFTFSGGETHINITGMVKSTSKKKLTVVITCKIFNADDFMKIILAKDALENLGVKNFELIIPYLPYARQDRVCNTGEAFSLKVFTNLINYANFNKVTILDPHSEIGSVLINNVNVVDNFSFIHTILQQDHINKPCEIVLISPDHGASKKMKTLVQKLSTYYSKYDFIIVQADKTRDPKTGTITGFKIYEPELVKNVPCIVIDDLCDGGATFLGLAVELRKYTLQKLYLAVTHGIFSKGLDKLLYFYDTIYTTNSFTTETQSQKFKIIDINYE